VIPRPADAAALSLRSAALDDVVQPPQWVQLTPWLAVGCAWLTAAVVITGAECTWPFPNDQDGTACLVTPEGSDAFDAGPPAVPQVVYFVRAASPDVHNGVPSVDGVAVTDGDRVLRLRDGLPEELTQYHAATGQFVSIASLTTTVAQPTLILSDDGRGWYLAVAGGAAVALRVLSTVAHARGELRDAFRTRYGTGTAVRAAFALLRRRSDGYYPAVPLCVTTNVLTNQSPAGWSWLYPLSLSDGSDRFSADAFTDGLVGAAGSGEYAALRRRVGPRLVGDPRPPEYLRVNFDMGGEVVPGSLPGAATLCDAGLCVGTVERRNLPHTDASRLQPARILR
jgi:hypothetical protein